MRNSIFQHLLPQRNHVSQLGRKSLDFMTNTVMARYISPETLSSLQVLQSESHPNAFNQGPGKASSQAKENFSLYGLFYQHASTSQGKARLRQFFLRPSTQLEVIEERHCMVDMFLQPANAPIFQRLSSIMKRIRNIRPVMANLRKGLNSGRGAFGGLKGTVWDALLIVCLQAQVIQMRIGIYLTERSSHFMQSKSGKRFENLHGHQCPCHFEIGYMLASCDSMLWLTEKDHRSI